MKAKARQDARIWRDGEHWQDDIECQRWAAFWLLGVDPFYWGA